VYYAKEHLMMDFPDELNMSEWNPDPNAAETPD
jgi:hypothetical protein